MLHYLDRDLSVEGDESVLDCLLRHGVSIGSSCRAGLCQSCLVQGATEPPLAAQRGLKEALVARHFFMACQCPARVSPAIIAEDALPTFPSQVLEAKQLAPDVFRVLVERPSAFDFEGGQFVHLIRPMDGLTRPYSIASSNRDPHLELHVARLSRGQMSAYLTEGAHVPLLLRGPAGDCTYRHKSAEPLLLVGTGTGLAPLMGILRAALDAGHQAPVHLVHGARHLDGLYLHDELQLLQTQHAALCYEESIWMADSGTPDVRHVDIVQLIRRDFPQLTGHRVYLCGHPDLVHALKRQCFLAGAAMSMIHSDPFVSASPSPP